jgi:hypothetical protein
MTRARHSPSQSVILARMAATRAELLTGNRATAPVSNSNRRSLLPPMQQGPLFLQTPYAGLIAAALIVATVLGPGHLVRVLVKRGLLPWITSTTRTVLNR